MTIASSAVHFRVNGRAVEVRAAPLACLADALREELGLTGTKIGCNAGDCGACTVLLDGEQVCACMIPVGRVAGREVMTVEGLANRDGISALQAAFLRHGAAQCGICTPGMLMAAHDLLRRRPHPSEQEAMDALGGVLCRCTGYRKIVEAVLDVSGVGLGPQPAAGEAVGARMPKVDGIRKLTGEEIYGADAAPEGALWMRVVRSPHARARFAVGDMAALYEKYPGLVDVLTERDVPGSNAFGIYPEGKDQPVLASGEVRYRGEAVVALVGEQSTIAAIRDRDVPISWEPLAPILGIEAALAPGAALVQAEKAGNVLTRGVVRKGDVEAALAAGDFIAEGRWRTSFVEHAYIEPEAGWAAARRRPAHGRGDHPDALHGSRRDRARPRDRERTGTGDPDGLRRRLRRQARRLGPAAPRRRGLEARPSGPLHLHAAGEHGGNHQAPPGADARPRRLPQGRHLDRVRVPRRLRYRRLRILGTDRRQSGPSPCRSALRRAEHQNTHARRPHERAPSGAFRGFGVPKRHRTRGAPTTTLPRNFGLDASSSGYGMRCARMTNGTGRVQVDGERRAPSIPRRPETALAPGAT